MKKTYFLFLYMQYIQGISRNQLQMGSLEDKITSDNPVRFIEAFVKTILNNFKNAIISYLNFRILNFN
jgi:hypothetical protein